MWPLGRAKTHHGTCRWAKIVPSISNRALVLRYELSLREVVIVSKMAEWAPLQASEWYKGEGYLMQGT